MALQIPTTSATYGLNQLISMSRSRKTDLPGRVVTKTKYFTDKKVSTSSNNSGTEHTKALRDTARLLPSKCPRREHFDLEHAGRRLELFADLAPSMKPGKFPVVRGERDRRVSQDTPYIKESMGAAIEW